MDLVFPEKKAKVENLSEMEKIFIIYHKKTPFNLSLLWGTTEVLKTEVDDKLENDTVKLYKSLRYYRNPSG